MSKARTWNGAMVVVAVGLVLAAGSAHALPTFIGPGPAGTFNGYQLNSSSATWDAARVAAASQTFAGKTGHLATIHSAAENTWINTNMGGGDRWIGLTDSHVTSTIDSATMPATEGSFAWITGEPLTYTNWNGGEPNDSGGNEDAVHMTGAAVWNDHRTGSTLGQAPDHNLNSIVEYELGLLSATPPDYMRALNIRERTAAGTFPGSGGPGTVRNVADAFALLALASGHPDIAAESTYLNDRINYGSGSVANFPNDDPPVLGGDNYTIEATGSVFIPAAGLWTFGTNTDDGSWLGVGPFTKIDDVLSGPHDHLATFSFGAAGYYNLQLVFTEATGGDEVELFAAQGAHGSFNASFRLVGDVANGGLAVFAGEDLPEPATMTLLAFGGIGALLRRRRRRKTA